MLILFHNFIWICIIRASGRHNNCVPIYQIECGDQFVGITVRVYARHGAMSLLKPNPFNNITVCNVAFSQSDINARRLMSESVALNRVHSSNDGITILNCISSARWTERSAGGGEITVSVLLTRLSHAHLTRIVHVLYKGKTEALTQVPQGIDGL